MSADPQPTTPGPGATRPGMLQPALAVVLGLAVVGFFVGTGAPPIEGSPLVQSDGDNDAHIDSFMPTYSDAQTRASGVGMDWDKELASLRGDGRTATVSLEGTSKADDLKARANLRAYDGAPPTIPHAVRQSSAAECLACHDAGMQLRGRVARPMSHAPYASCTQCHVVAEAPMPGPTLAPDATFATNTFVGLASPVAGPRAWDIAPPVIPHRQFMRERCMSCHGPNGRDAMRSTHPDRQQCVQCHAAQSGLEQRPVLTHPSAQETRP